MTASRPTTRRLPTLGYAVYTLALLFSMDVLNYTDRFALSANLEDIGRAFSLDDIQRGWLYTYFIIGYVCAAPITGYLADRFNRTRIVAACVAIFSGATIASGLATDYTHLALARAFIGIGEAGYLVAAPTLVADSFRRGQRGKMMAILYLGMPIGTALGFMGGSSLADAWNWRVAFYVIGVPGLVAAGLMAFVKEPPRGAIERLTGRQPRRKDRRQAADAAVPEAAVVVAYRPSWRDYGLLLKHRTYLLVLATFTLVAFSGGGLVHWSVTYLERVRHYENATYIFGPAAVVGGILGAVLAGAIGDRLVRRTPAAYLYVAMCGYLLGVPALYAALWAGASRIVEIVGFGIGVGAVSMSIIALNTTISNIVVPNLRAAAYALLIFFQHILGDAVSPPLIGWVSEVYAGGADTTQGLSFALHLAPLPMLLAAGTAFWAARCLRRDHASIQADFDHALTRGDAT